jgi:Na+-driven multidrug efflux pump
VTLNSKASAQVHLDYGSFLGLALPAVASSLLNNLYRIIDQYSVQWLGTHSQAALGACAFILIAFTDDQHSSKHLVKAV